MGYIKEDLEKVFDKVCLDLENSLTIKHSLASQGVSRSTFYRYIDMEQNEALKTLKSLNNNSRNYL